MSEDKNVQAQPVEKVEVTPEVAPKDETKASELYEKKEPRVVPEAKFLEYKKENKELRKEIAQIKQMIADGATKGEVKDEIETLAEEHNLDADFLRKLTSTIENKVSKREVKDEIENEPKRPVDIDKIFNAHFDGVIAHLPEFKNIVNKEILKTLSLDPKNGNKTLTQLIEETYGNALSGKRTLDTAKTSKEPQTLDYKRAQTDTEYRRNVVFADPEMKRQYNAQMLSKGL